MRKQVTINLAEKRGRQRVNIVKPERDIERKSLGKPAVLPGADPFNDRDCVPQQSGPWTGSPCDEITDPGGTVVAWVPPCDPTQEVTLRLYFTGASTGLSLSIDSAWTGSDPGFSYSLLTDTPTGSQGDAGASWSAVNSPAGNYAINGYVIELTDGLLAAMQGGAAVHFQMRARSRSGIGINEASQDNVLAAGARVYRDGVGFIGTALNVGEIGSTKFAAQTLYVNRIGTATLGSVADAQTGDYLVLEIGVGHRGPISGGTGATISFTLGVGSDLPVDESTTSIFNAWLGVGYVQENDCPPPAAPGFVTGGREINQVASRLTPTTYEICVTASEILAVRVDGFLLFGWTWDGERTITLPYAISDDLEVTVQYVA